MVADGRTGVPSKPGDLSNKSYKNIIVTKYEVQYF
jgi:hypothetical protein